jgi:alkylated DNA repair protein alkB family protein 6
MSVVGSLRGGDDLRCFRIETLPPDFYYVPDFITREEEASILDKVLAKQSLFI